MYQPLHHSFALSARERKRGDTMITKSYNSKQQRSILKDNGYSIYRITGAHKMYRNQKGQIITVSAHGTKISDTSFNKMVKMFNLIIER